MANTITADCIGCGNCELECIHGAIRPSGELYAIDPARCDGCDSLPCGCRCVRVCPTDAIWPEHPARRPMRPRGSFGVGIAV